MNILHLTDLHFSIEDDKEHVANKWKEIITLARSNHEKTPIDVIAVTGDVTCHGMKEEFDQAKNYLLKLLRALSLEKECLWLCPGNHDADSEEAHSTFAHYEEFAENFKKQTIADHRRPFFAFYSINTCTETSLTFFDRAVIPSDDAEVLSARDKKNYGILLMHHQPEVIKNQDMLMKIANGGKIRLILCGHLHSTDTRLYSVNNCVVVNGMAVTPHLPWLFAGMQIVHISTRGRVETKAIHLSGK